MSGRLWPACMKGVNGMKKDIAKRLTENESQLIDVIRIVTKSNIEVWHELLFIDTNNTISLDLEIIINRLLKTMEDYK